MAVFTAVFTILMRKQIALLYNDNPEVVTLASQLMLLAAIYQISDSIQVIGSGILRGYKDHAFHLLYHLYRLLGIGTAERLPAGADRYRGTAHGPAGFWCGFIIGLTSAAVMMMLRMRFLAASAFQRHFTTRGALARHGSEVAIQTALISAAVFSSW
ncbi:multi antimicrobial extrusion protein (Na(+)/drug antiporter) [Klebsiella michiganensis]|uniref:Multi antimicrobial extrusion protein (Na(+)/drug antiporter) n=1 Tax=Klebsiella michiganensis TaxID=1134687 RepID=A0A7H4PLP1_9ENTR|nr:multi antimicrobial extrusion protein (Na(+)/drug antiporter) [Klebsiella michiganensis]